MSIDVSLSIRWHELFDKAMPAIERRKRWATWLRLARQVDRGLARSWAGQQERCCDCANSRGGWCRTQELPCAVNPILTMRHNIQGMACMGVGFVPRQLSLSLGAAQ